MLLIIPYSATNVADCQRNETTRKIVKNTKQNCSLFLHVHVIWNWVYCLFFYFNFCVQDFHSIIYKLLAVDFHEWGEFLIKIVKASERFKKK